MTTMLLLCGWLVIWYIEQRRVDRAITGLDQRLQYVERQVYGR